MTLHRSAAIGSIALAVPFALFLWFCHAADRAMDKTGIGDPALWGVFNVRADIALWSTGAVWFLLLGVALSRRRSERSQLLSVCGIALLAAPIVWVISIFGF